MRGHWRRHQGDVIKTGAVKSQCSQSDTLRTLFFLNPPLTVRRSSRFRRYLQTDLRVLWRSPTSLVPSSWNIFEHVCVCISFCFGDSQTRGAHARPAWSADVHARALNGFQLICSDFHKIGRMGIRSEPNGAGRGPIGADRRSRRSGLVIQGSLICKHTCP